MGIEKVIKGLKCLTSMSDCTTCPYSYNKQREFCLCDIGKDATELLKEQQKEIHNLNAMLEGIEFLKDNGLN